ncbi:MAG: pilus assembly protein [Rhodospirillales bacterium]
MPRLPSIVLRERLTRFGRDRRGVIMVMFALLLPVLAGSIGMGVEVALWYKEKRSIQSAADAAAVSGAYEALESGATSATITAQASADAARNGFDTVANPPTVNNPPASGAYTADNDAVEVILSESFTMLFASVITDSATVTVSARAVATSTTFGEACVLSLNTSGTGVQVTGSGDVTFDGCMVASNSSDSSALDVSGSGDLEVDCYSVVGGVSASPGLTTDAGCNGQTGAAAVADPYADLSTPAYGACDEPGGYTLNNNNSNTFDHDDDFETAYVICGDLTVRGDLTLEPGLYIVEGDISVNATGSLQGDGVTIILKNGGQIDNFNGSADIDLSAPSDASAGDWQGMLFYQDRDDAATCTGNNCNTLNGSSTSTFEGTIYFPNQEVSVLGGNTSGSPGCLQMVAYQVTFSGNSSMAADNSECFDAGVDPIEIPGPIALVE